MKQFSLEETMTNVSSIVRRGIYTYIHIYIKSILKVKREDIKVNHTNSKVNTQIWNLLYLILLTFKEKTY